MSNYGIFQEYDASMHSEERRMEQKKYEIAKCVERREKQMYAMSNRKSLNCVTMLQNITTKHT